MIRDIAITKAGKTLLKKGGGGRSSVNGFTATVFGATGFLGRYVVNRLARQGTTVVIPFREEMTKRHLKVCGDLGQVLFLEMDLRNQLSIEEAVKHSDIVYNLIGRDYETKNFNFEDVHVQGAVTIAEAAAKYNVARLVHLSSFNADPKSSSSFFATKGVAETRVRECFPDATIVRPSVMYGAEDRFINRLASVVHLYSVNHNHEIVWPVHVKDVGRALYQMMLDDSSAGQTFELYGPKSLSIKQVTELINKHTGRKHRLFNIPKPAMLLFSRALSYLWWNVLSPDEIERQFIDQQIDTTAKTFADLGITPDEFENTIPKYIRFYRPSSLYNAPPDTPREKKELAESIHVTN